MSFYCENCEERGEAAETECESLRSRLAEREAQIKRWQDSSGCVGTFCKADILLDRNRELLTERALLVTRAENAEAALVEIQTEIDAVLREALRHDTRPDLRAAIEAHLARTL